MFRTCKNWRILALASLVAAGCQHGQPQLASNYSAPPPEASPKLGKEQVADVQIALGRSLEKQGSLDEAIQAYHNVLAKNPQRADVYARLAIVADKQARFNDSAPLHKRAIALDKTNADYYCNAGYSLYLQQDWENAEQCLSQAIQLKPDHARAHNNLGLVLARTGHTKEALAEFRKAGCSEADCHNNLAHALALNGAFPLAQRNYQLALKADPNSAMAQRGLATIQAMEARQKAGQTGTQNAGVQNNSGPQLTGLVPVEAPR